VKPWAWKGRTSCNSTGWGLPGWGTALVKRPGGVGGPQAETGLNKSIVV